MAKMKTMPKIMKKRKLVENDKEESIEKEEEDNAKNYGEEKDEICFKKWNSAVC